MLYSSEELELRGVMDVADKMCVAARTAPKGRGVDNIVTCAVTGEEKDMISKKMDEIAEREGIDFFKRDANGIRQAAVVIFIGLKSAIRGIPYCGLCGFKNCDENIKAGGACAVNISDLGIAIGSAVSIAADNRVDNRIMFSAGRAAKDLKIFGDNVDIIYGIPLIVKGKNIFFDRK